MKHQKPVTPGSRQRVSLNYRELLTGDRPEKSLVSGGKRHVGRNSAGRITIRHKGGGHKRLFRDVDFYFLDKEGVPARVQSLEYDPARSGFIALLVYRDGDKRYALAPHGVKVGDEVVTAPKTVVKPGNRLELGNTPVGTFVYNIELKPRGGAKLVRSAGVFAEVVAHDAGYTLLKLPSTEIRRVSDHCYASVGSVSNPENHLVVISKAGRSRWLGIRPTVRGSAMNPVDHPHGGGEGRQGRGLRRAKSLWGKPTGKGQKSRTPKKYSNKFIVTRRIVGKKGKEK
ncbi:MAG: 50S ribosomal protein L2 [Patescibacteria group bacterium]